MNRPPGCDAPSSRRVAEAHAAGHHPVLVGAGRPGCRTSRRGGRRRARPSGELPTPSARAASWALQTAGKMEPPVGSAWTKPNRNSGTSSKWSASHCADRCTLSIWMLDSHRGPPGRGQPVGVDGPPELLDGVSVERSDPPDDVRVVDQQKPPVLGVPAGGGPDGGVEDPGLDLERHRIGTDPAAWPGWCTALRRRPRGSLLVRSRWHHREHQVASPPRQRRRVAPP